MRNLIRYFIEINNLDICIMLSTKFGQVILTIKVKSGFEICKQPVNRL